MIEFNSTTDFQQYVNISADYPFDKFMVFIDQARIDFEQFFGEDWKTLENTHSLSTTFDDSLESLTRMAVVCKAMVYALDESSMNLSDNGATVYKGSTDIVASDAKIKQYRDSVEKRWRSAVTFILDIMKSCPEYFAIGKQLNNQTCMVQHVRQTYNTRISMSTLECYEAYGALLQAQEELELTDALKESLLKDADNLMGDMMVLLMMCRNYILERVHNVESTEISRLKAEIEKKIYRISFVPQTTPTINSELTGIFTT